MQDTTDHGKRCVKLFLLLKALAKFTRYPGYPTLGCLDRILPVWPDYNFFHFYKANFLRLLIEGGIK